MNDTLFGELSVIAMKGCEEFGTQVDYYLKEWRGRPQNETYFVRHECPRFAREAVYISSMHMTLYHLHVFNHGVTYNM